MNVKNMESKKYKVRKLSYLDIISIKSEGEDTVLSRYIFNSPIIMQSNQLIFIEIQRCVG